MGHGSQYHRGVGSMGTLLPMHVLKGKKLPGHMGNEQVTIQNLVVVKVDLENNLILIKGNVPGPKKSLVIIREGVKSSNKKVTPVELITYEVAEENAPVTEETVEEAAEVTEEAPVEETAEETTETEATEETSTSQE